MKVTHACDRCKILIGEGSVRLIRTVWGNIELCRECDDVFRNKFMNTTYHLYDSSVLLAAAAVCSPLLVLLLIMILA
jgi:hypothetical protein